MYHALYLEHLTSQELLEKLAKLYNVSGDQIGELYCQGPSGIYVLLNDEVLQNMSEQSRFCVEAMKCKTLSINMCMSVGWKGGMVGRGDQGPREHLCTVQILCRSHEI